MHGDVGAAIVLNALDARKMRYGQGNPSKARHSPEARYRLETVPTAPESQCRTLAARRRSVL